MARWVRHGAPAGVSLLLGFLVGTLADIFTEGRSWAVGVGLVVLLASWIGLEMRLAAQNATSTAASGPAPGAAAVVPAQRPPIVPQQLPPPTAHFVGRESQLATLNGLLAGTRANARDAVATVTSTITRRQSPVMSRPYSYSRTSTTAHSKPRPSPASARLIAPPAITPPPTLPGGKRWRSWTGSTTPAPSRSAPGWPRWASPKASPWTDPTGYTSA